MKRTSELERNASQATNVGSVLQRCRLGQQRPFLLQILNDLILWYWNLYARELAL